jgi:site-specific recombinase XerD
VCDARTVGGAREAALLGVLYACGVRRSELVGLEVRDYAPATGAVLVRGKGDKERRVFMTCGAREAVDRWLVHRGAEVGPLFTPVRKNGRIVLRRMSGQAIVQLVRRLAIAARVAPFGPHDIRRTCIGDLLDAVADLPTVQALVGHADPATTARYDRRGDRARRRAAELPHVPVGRLAAVDPSASQPERTNASVAAIGRP